MKFAFKLSELSQLEANVGFTIGILVGATAGAVYLLFFTTWEWYFKLFSGIGSIGIIGSLILSLMQQIKARRGYLEAMKQMKEMSSIFNDVKPEDKVILDEAVKGGTQ